MWLILRLVVIKPWHLWKGKGYSCSFINIKKRDMVNTTWELTIDCSWLAKRMCFQVLMKNMCKPLLDKSTWHSKKMLINYNFLRNVIWSLYFYFSFFVFIFQIIQVLFPVKIDLSPSSSSSSYVCNLKSHNLTSRKHLINHLVKYPHEETEAQRG